MEPTLIDLNDYVRTGEGANGASFNYKTDPNIMMKLYLRNFDSARTELEMARKETTLRMRDVHLKRMQEQLMDMQDHLDVVDKLSKYELLEVVGGRSISGTLINAFTSTFKMVYGFGQDFGGAIRRFKKRTLCGF